MAPFDRIPGLPVLLTSLVDRHMGWMVIFLLIPVVYNRTWYHLRGTNNEGAPIEFWFRTDTFSPVKAQLHTLSSADFQDATLSYRNLDGAITIDMPTLP